VKVPTVCPYCGVGCMLYLHIRNGKVVSVTPHENGPGEGKLCIKGWSAHEFIHHGDRLTKPLIWRGGEFREATWMEALSLIAKRLEGVKKRDGSDAVALLSSAKTTNEENYLLQKLARAVIGTNNIDHCARLCHASTVTGLIESFGSGAMTNSQEDLEEADAIFVIGTNTSEQHPLIARRIIRAAKRGSKLVIADPRTIDLTAYAKVHLCQRPGTDVALVNAMMNVIISDGLEDGSFIEARTEGYDALKRAVRSYTPEAVERIVGAPADEIREAARVFANAERAAIVFSMGITQHTTGVDNVVTLANLAMLTGNIGRPGTGVNPLRGQNNVQGACDMGALPDFLPGYKRIEDSNARSAYTEAWGVECPSEPGLTVVEMMDECGQGIKAMYIMGENPLVTDPDVNHVRRQMAKLDFLAVSELFLSDTAGIADVVLPAASFAEKAGTFTATDRRVQRVRRGVEPVGESLPDWKIISRLAGLMGYPMDYGSPRGVMDEIVRLVPIYGGISYGRLEKQDLRWPCLNPDHPGTKILHVESFTRGKGMFIPAEYRSPAEEPDSQYPYILTTGRVLFHFHSGTMTRRSSTLTSQLDEAYVEVNTEDAAQLRISDGELVRVRSRRGEISLRALVTNGIKRGVVFIPFHFSEAAANELTNAALDPRAKIPELKVCAVNIEKAS